MWGFKTFVNLNLLCMIILWLRFSVPLLQLVFSRTISLKVVVVINLNWSLGIGLVIRVVCLDILECYVIFFFETVWEC